MLIQDLKFYCPHSIPMHMPGHKRNTLLADYLDQLGAGLDITEIDHFDDLHAPDGMLYFSMREAAQLWGSEESIFLVCGSTGGILSAIYTLAPGGGKAIIARNCHKSVYHALELTGVEPRFLLPEAGDIPGACGKISPASVERALAETPDARFLLLTSPTYEGIISDVREICRLAHEKNVPVIVDEAHGAHLGLYGVFPANSVQAGADIVIQSLHKTLPSLTQTAIAHLNGPRVDHRAFWHALDIFETSSPSYLLLASIDGCVQLMKDSGEGLLKTWLRALDDFYDKAQGLKNLRIRRRPDQDPSKIVIETACSVLSGFDLLTILRRQHHVELEMAMPDYALAMTGAGDTPETLDILLTALFRIDKSLSPCDAPIRVLPAFTELPEIALSPRQALAAPRRTVDADQSAGLISAEYAWVYPPGIPLIVPGERIPSSFPALWSRLRLTSARTLTTGGDPARLSVVAE